MAAPDLERDMSQQELKASAEEIAAGLKKLGADRVVALSVHKSKELVAELEIKIAKLIEQLD